jgi:hypothetical protein
MPEERKETDDVAGAARAAADPLAQSAAEADAAGETNGQDETEDDGEADSDPAEAEVVPALEPAPAAVADLAAACIRYVATRYGAELDFSPETLSFVDQWVRDARAELARRPEVADVVQSAAGAYLGEVIRRTFGGAWILPHDPGDLAGWRLGLATVYCAFNPLGMAREALTLSPAEGWHAHFELDPGEREEIEQRLAALPPVDDEEFFAPSTRFDVVWIMVDALHAAMHARGLGNTLFSADDYR